MHQKSSKSNMKEENSIGANEAVDDDKKKSAQKAGRWIRSMAHLRTSLNPQFTEPIPTVDGKRARRSLNFAIEHISPVRRIDIPRSKTTLIDNLLNAVRSSINQNKNQESERVMHGIEPLPTVIANTEPKVEPIEPQLPVKILKVMVKQIKTDPPNFLDEGIITDDMQPLITTKPMDEPTETMDTEFIDLKPILNDTSQQVVLSGGSLFSSFSELRDLHSEAVSPSALSSDSGRASSIVSDINCIDLFHIYWCKYKQFIYWPAIVFPDDEGNWKKEAKGRYEIHVKYFHDNGRRSWCRMDYLVPFEGFVKYQQFINTSLKVEKKKPLSKFIKPNTAIMRTKWIAAIQEATDIQGFDISLREQKFMELVEHAAIQMKRLRNNKVPKNGLNSSAATNIIAEPIDTNETTVESNQNVQIEASPPPIPAISPIKRKADEIANVVSDQNPNVEPNVQLRRSMRRSMKINVVPKTPPKPPSPPKIQKQKKNKEPVPVKSVEEVVASMVQLDSRYLFKGVPKAGPVCKYCWQPGEKLQRCNKWCGGWVHAICNTDETLNPLNALKPQRKQKPKPKRKSTFGRVRRKSVAKSVASVATSTTSTVTTISADENEVTSDLEQVPPIVCRDCALQETPLCFICKQAQSSNASELLFCEVAHCNRAYHQSCCRYWPQARFNGSNFRCASHMCHACVSDDPRVGNHYLAEAKSIRCILCPATYHSDSFCIPAGTMILTTTQIVCSRHVQIEKAVNASWCFSCAKEKSPEESTLPDKDRLLCCDTCPLTIHKACAKSNPTEAEVYICEECESGRLLMYLEVVWTKYRGFRWWPAIIVPPEKIPANIKSQPHDALDFVVWFLGTYDYVWLSKRRCYLYIDEDRGRFDCHSQRRKTLNAQYLTAVAEAPRVYTILKEALLKFSIKSRHSYRPTKYVSIRKNHGTYPQKEALEKASKCNCKVEMDRPCGPESNCLNRCLSVGCPKDCPAGERCENQMFDGKNPLIPHLETRYMQERNFGLITKVPIAAGTFVIEYVGEIISDAEYQRRKEKKRLNGDESYYFLCLKGQFTIDAEPKGNLARFMNHSCDPNCQSEKWVINGVTRVGIFAIKDIPAQTELTFNYNWEDDDIQSFRKKCCCGSENCSGILGVKPKEKAIPPKTAIKKDLKRLQNGKSVRKIKKPAADGKRRRTLATKVGEPNLETRTIARSKSQD